MARTMSVTPGNLSLNGTSFLSEHRSIIDEPSEQKTWNVFLFCLTFAFALPALLGSIYSLVSLLKLQTKSTVSMIVTSLAADDLISIVPVIIFMLMQWSSQVLPQPLCTTSAFLYLFQGISSNLKGSLIVSYNFYTLSTPGTLSCSSSKRRVSVAWAILTIWTASLLLCVLPLCGWGRYIATSWGCFADRASSHALLVLVVYSLCLSLLAALAVPLALHLLCSGEPRLLHPEHRPGSAGCGCPGTPPLPSLEPGDRAREPCPAPEALFGKGEAESSARSRSSAVGLAQKRFSLVLALAKVLLWLPMMIQMAVQYTTGLQSLSFEALGFLLSVLAAAVTPVFVLSQHWLHLPCGCIINCRRSSYAVSSPGAEAKRGGFELNLSFQQGCGIYRIPLESPAQASRDGRASSYPRDSLGQTGTGALGHGPQGTRAGTGPCQNTRAGTGPCQDQQGTRAGTGPCQDQQGTRAGTGPCQDQQGTRAGTGPCQEQQGTRAGTGPCQEQQGTRAGTGPCQEQQGTRAGTGPCQEQQGTRAGTGPCQEQQGTRAGTGPCQEQQGTSPGPFPEGAEWRLWHQDSHTPELADWEWSRSRSERNPRQRTGGALAVPLCAFQGTVSLPAPGGKTLSLSTYEVSSEGQRIAPAARTIEVYRSKSVGHEPSPAEPGFADTSVRIHLEVLEICDTAEAPDTVSIVSSISQSSAHARSPSLRYSRKENRFVSCELGESASYSLLVPSNSDFSISIPDTVEAHRRNSQQQHPARAGYQEEIQLLNKAYREREDTGSG